VAVAERPEPDVPRVLILVCDSFGVGDAPDAQAYGDAGSDTLGNTAAPSAGSARRTSARSGSAC
jgi:phosphopentomutase